MIRMLAHCDAKALITIASILDELQSVDAPLMRGYRAIITDRPSRHENAIAHDFSNKADVFVCPEPANDDDTAYILYTSGSTGEPKGVVHSHRSAVRFVDWAFRAFELGPCQKLTNFAPLSFDLSILDIFGALSSGASVEVLQTELLLRPKELVKKLGQWGITLLYAVPSAIALLESDGDLHNRPPESLSRVLYAGEPFSVPPLSRVMRALPKARFFNLFGPTETNVCTFHALGETIDETTPQIRIGKPCDHLTVELLDAHGKPTQLEEEGEICVAGPSVMTEYFRQPEATRDAFFNGSHFVDGQARYRTGDRARLDRDCNFWFLGRRDRMVKRRGYRVELGEIESALDRVPAVRESAVISLSTSDGVHVRAAVVLRDGPKLSVLTLKAECGRLLPPYMVPDSISILSELPRTANGKVDLIKLGELCTV